MSPVLGRWPGASHRTADTQCDVAKPRGYRRTPGTPLRGGDSSPPGFGGHTCLETGRAEKVVSEFSAVSAVVPRGARRAGCATGRGAVGPWGVRRKDLLGDLITFLLGSEARRRRITAV